MYDLTLQKLLLLQRIGQMLRTIDLKMDARIDEDVSLAELRRQLIEAARRRAGSKSADSSA